MVIIISPGSQVASGVPVELSATEFTNSFGANWDVRNVPGKSAGSTYNFRLPIGKFLGFNSPLFTATGHIDTEFQNTWKGNPDPTTGHYYMTGSMLHGFATEGSVVALIDARTIYGRQYGAGSMTYGVVTGYNISRNVGTSAGTGSYGYLIDYSITIQESQV